MLEHAIMRSDQPQKHYRLSLVYVLQMFPLKEGDIIIRGKLLLENSETETKLLVKGLWV